MGQIYIGTSGWSYKSWQRTFYPETIPVSRHFEFYSAQFPTVEINLTFYRLPASAMVEGWRRKAPEGFVYAVKVSRFITHMKKLARLDGAAHLRKEARAGKTVYAYFNNDANYRAPRNARLLMEMTGALSVVSRALAA